MTDQLPAPPVPADADLTDFKFMPLEVARLRRSKAWLICKRRPDLAFFMLNLWTAAWHERPAGSLEDDDDVLADAAMCSPERWGKVRTEVLRGWFKCADGRLYHDVVAEKVLDSWHGKAVARWSKECDRIRKENHKRKENQLPPLDFPPKPARISADAPPETPPPGGGIPPEKPLKGEGRDREREGIGKGDSVASATSARAAVPPEDDLAVPLFLRQPGTRIAQPIAPDWLPSQDTQDALAKARPDLTPERIVERTAEFHRWCAEGKRVTHNADSTWYSFMVKTHDKPTGQGRTDSRAPTVADGVDAAFARRSVPA